MSKVYFYAFDIINNNTYHQRVIELDSLLIGLNNSRIVPWKIIKSEAELFSTHKKYVNDGYEGTMIRNLSSLYQANKRSYDLLKLKDFLDEEFEIIGWKTGKGKFSNIPTFLLVTREKKTFEAVPKGTEEERGIYLAEANNYIGKFATIRFFEYTADGIPRFPVLINIDRFSYE
jgi:DNA ligase-1